MLRGLFHTFALIAFVAWHGPALSFDSGRFYRDDTQSADIYLPGSHTERSNGLDAFELSPSGRIDRVAPADRVNTNSIEFNRTISQEVGPFEELGPRKVMNTRYSLLGAQYGLTEKCRPSPMTATEIEELVVRTAESYGVDPNFAKAIAWTESRFDRNRNSPKGARGPMQLMPATARDLGVKDICDPQSNVDGGIRHLKLMLEEFQNPVLAAAAYNAGAQAVYDNGGVPPFRETVRYVAAVINHRIGLPISQTNSARGNTAGIGTPSTNEMASDVIGTQGSRFIKGVMQF